MKINGMSINTKTERREQGEASGIRADVPNPFENPPRHKYELTSRVSVLTREREEVRVTQLMTELIPKSRSKAL